MNTVLAQVTMQMMVAEIEKIGGFEVTTTDPIAIPTDFVEFTAIDRILGVSVYGSYKYVYIKLRTVRSGYRTFFKCNTSDLDLVKFNAKLAEARTYKPLDPNNLPTPLDFIDAHCKSSDGSIYIETAAMVRTANVEQVVAIGRDGVLKDEVGIPGVGCWFLVRWSGIGKSLLRYSATDGDHYYIVNRSCTRLVVDPEHHDYESGKNLTKVDQHMFKAAIDAWLQR